LLHEQGQQGGRIIFLGIQSQLLQLQLSLALAAKFGTLGFTNGAESSGLRCWVTSIFFSEQESIAASKINVINSLILAFC
tara:strand:+ start:679 stop:918 length:240 start_codon:yes stop_codon:yes gene_type:complete